MEQGYIQQASAASKGYDVYHNEATRRYEEDRRKLIEQYELENQRREDLSRIDERIETNHGVETDWAGFSIEPNNKKTFGTKTVTSHEMRDIFRDERETPISTDPHKRHYANDIRFKSVNGCDPLGLGAVYQSSPGTSHGTEHWKTTKYSMENGECLGERNEEQVLTQRKGKGVKRSVLSSAREKEYKGMPSMYAYTTSSSCEGLVTGMRDSISKPGPNSFLKDMGSKIASTCGESSYTLRSNKLETDYSRASAIPGYQGHVPKDNSSITRNNPVLPRRITKDLIVENGKNGNRIHGYTGRKTTLW